MGSKVYIPAAFRCFQGFVVRDLKEFRKEQLIEIHLEHSGEHEPQCHHCGSRLGHYHSRHPLRLKHIRMMSWEVRVCFHRNKYHCAECKKIRSERIEFLCPVSPHITKELSWWVNRLTEMSAVNQVARLESIDKKTCYEVDKHILRNLLQGYKIPSIEALAVDEVYARSPQQMREGENKDDLFFTVIIDARTRRVIWVTQSRRKEALDEFFKLIGPSACKNIFVVATDQHEAYSQSVKQYCLQAKVVWDRFHLVQRFNEALNLDRDEELRRLIEAKEVSRDYLLRRHKFKFLTKAENRSTSAQKHIEKISKLNHKIAQMEMIKEHFHQLFECQNYLEAKRMFDECVRWAFESKARCLLKWLKSIRKDARFWNFFTHKLTNGVAEGINRVIKGLKWQAFGYRDMDYFILKILQKVGYLNSRYCSHLFT